VPYWTYILASRKHGTLYVGCTANLSWRIEQHRTALVSSFTRKYRVFRLVHAEEYPTLAEARERERRLKRWRRAWKVQLIESGNPEWVDLFERH
jgi:putative endonuclease